MRNTILISTLILSMTGVAMADPYNNNYHIHHYNSGNNILPWIAGAATLGIVGAIIANQPRCWIQKEELYDHYGNFIGFHNVKYCE